MIVWILIAAVHRRAYRRVRRLPTAMCKMRREREMGPHLLYQFWRRSEATLKRLWDVARAVLSTIICDDRSVMTHVVLLGDSILDNGPYVARGEAVIDHLRRLAPDGWRSTLLAVDGSVTNDVVGQLARVPKDATHLMISVGGNDALGHSGILEQRAEWVAEVIGELADIADAFEDRYRRMLARALRLGLPTALCTIYYPRFEDPTFQRLAVTASSVFNDVILRAAFANGLPVMDLRLICDEDSDYANPIEPSSSGGRKIVQKMLHLLAHHDFARGRTEVFV
jgi:lysophospholipase L1-like esterase